jgi:hypothetical protein
MFQPAASVALGCSVLELSAFSRLRFATSGLRSPELTPPALACKKPSVLQISGDASAHAGILGRSSVELAHRPWVSAQRSLGSSDPVWDDDCTGP